MPAGDYKKLLVTPLSRDLKDPQGPHIFTSEWLHLETEDFKRNGIDLKEFTRNW